MPERIITLERLNDLLDELLEDFQRRQDQAILQQDLYKAVYALSGKETCAEVKRRLRLAVDMDEHVRVVTESRRRA